MQRQSAKPKHRISGKFPNSLPLAFAGQQRAKAASTLSRPRRTAGAYGIHFYETVTTRQAVSICRDGIDHQRDLALIDSEIDAFNNLIAAQCGG
jgi:hypothetical protein